MQSMDLTFGTDVGMAAQRIDAETAGRHQRMKRAWGLYYGEHKKPLVVKSGKPDDNIIVNYARLIVDVGVGFLFGEPGTDKELRFSIDGDVTSESSPEAWLNAVWRDNRKMTTLFKVGLNGSVCGHPFVKVMAGRAGGMPRVIVLDPAHVEAEWSVDDVDALERVTIAYETTEHGKLVKYRQVIALVDGRWLITDERAVGNSSRFSEISREVWPYSWCPVHHCQNLPDPNVFWGMSDLEEDVIALNESANFVLSNLNRILRYHAHPKTWGKGVKAAEMQVAPDGAILLNNPDASLNNLEMLSDLSSSIEFFGQVRQALREITHVPEVALGGMADASRVSSLALKVMYSPLLMHTGKKRATYGEMLQELNAHLLEMGNFGRGMVVRNVWPHILPTDPMQDAQVAVMHEQLGVSKRTIVDRLGFDADLERLRREDEAESLGEAILKQFDAGNG